MCCHGQGTWLECKFIFSFFFFKYAWKRHLWDMKKKIISKLSRRAGNHYWKYSPHLPWLWALLSDGWQWEEQRQKWWIDIYKYGTEKLRFPQGALCENSPSVRLESSRTTWTHLHPKMWNFGFPENGQRGEKTHKNASVHILCAGLQFWGLRARGQCTLNSLGEGNNSWHNF